MRRFTKQYYHEIIGGVLCLMLGTLSGYGVQAGNYTWYSNLIKPTFNPSNWIFAPVWSILYIAMGIALGSLWRNRPMNKLLIIVFIWRFILNMLWSPLFFYYQSIEWALYDICLLWLCLIFLMFLARKQHIIFLLLLPYVLWVSFALVLNYKIYEMNLG